jgi:hypothetical protein
MSLLRLIHWLVPLSRADLIWPVGPFYLKNVLFLFYMLKITEKKGKIFLSSGRDEPEFNMHPLRTRTFKIEIRAKVINL